VVEAKLRLRWSPEQIAGWLRLAYPDDPTMRIAHETIYLSLYVPHRGALRHDLRRCLRSEDVVLDEVAQRFDQAQTTLQQRPQGEPPLAAFRRAALEIAADMQTRSDQERAVARVIRTTPAIQARIRDRTGQWEEQLAAMIADERRAGADDLDSHVVAAALVGLPRSVQRVALAAEMQLDLPALMDHAFDLLESGLAPFAAHPQARQAR
jgi:hypothetical protein